MDLRPPYLSLVATVRNDDHGGNLLNRLQIFLNGWLDQARRYDIPSELILVEWNPPQDRPRLAQVLRLPSTPGPCPVRILEVPPEVHRRFRHADALPLYQMIAKNAGIRRARGSFILATNIDILFSEELAAFFAARRLEANRMYRVDRYDAMSGVPGEAGVVEQLAWARTHLIRINRREGTFPVTPDGAPALASPDIAAADAGILFGEGWYPAQTDATHELFRWADRDAALEVSPPRSPAVLVLDLEPGPGMGANPLVLRVAEGEFASQPVVISCRTRVRIALAPGAAVRHLLLRIEGGGEPIELDARNLNFRARSACWEEGSSAPGPAPLCLHASPDGVFARGRRVLRQIGLLMDRLAHGGPLVTVTIPVSIELRRVARTAARLLPHPGGPAPAAPAPPPPTPGRRPLLHTNACGDFTLAARENWFDLRGYPEFDLFSMNIDSIFCLRPTTAAPPKKCWAIPCASTTSSTAPAPAGPPKARPGYSSASQTRD